MYTMQYFHRFYHLLFTNWDRWSTMIWHAIFMGIVIEGINFYGIGELYLFITNNGPTIDMVSILVISCLCTVIYLFYFTLFFVEFVRHFIEINQCNKICKY